MQSKQSDYRRRRCPLMAIEELQSGDTEGISSPQLSSCPFSKTFPRYRIDLTTPKRKKQQPDGLWSLLPKVELPSLELPSPPWKEALQRGQLESILKLRNQSVDAIRLQSGVDGVSAFAWLWRECARLMGMGSPCPSETGVVLGLPDATESMVRNFCEILEWMMDEEYFPSDIKVSVELLKDDKLQFPAIRLQRVSTTEQPSFQNDPNQVEVINERTRMWVKRILVEQGICPFTKSDRMSGQGLKDLGVPVGSIAYHASFQKHPIGLFADTWKAIDQMLKAGPEGRTGVSSILLAAEEFDEDFDLWAGPIFAMLEAGVVAAGAESEVGVVCFHPRYATPDGKSWPGFGHMHSVPKLEKWYRETCDEEQRPHECALSTEQIAAGGAWQRRTPHATINVLRADQLEVAESRRVSGKMYTKNIDILVGVDGIGNERLALDLERERQQGSN